jgi:hypothetical protein
MNYMDCVLDLADGACVRCRLPVRAGVRRNCIAVSSPGANHPEIVDAPRIPQSSPGTPAGPGTELSALLKRFGIEPTPTCACRAKANEMDAWGCDECSRPERIEEVVGVMREEAKARGLPFLDVAGRMLVRRAIANARKAEARRAKEAEAAAAEGPAA